MCPFLLFTISFFVSKSQLGISETELKDLLCEREIKVEEIQESLKEIQVSLVGKTNLHITKVIYNTAPNQIMWEMLLNLNLIFPVLYVLLVFRPGCS